MVVFPVNTKISFPRVDLAGKKKLDLKKQGKMFGKIGKKWDFKVPVNTYDITFWRYVVWDL